MHMHDMDVGVFANTPCIFHHDEIVVTHGFSVPSFLFLFLFLLHVPGFPETPGRPVPTCQLRRRRWCVQSGPCSVAGASPCQAALWGEQDGRPMGL